MGACGCSSGNMEEAYRIGRHRATLGIDVTAGCPDCGYGPGVLLSIFDRPDSEFLDGLEPKTYRPDEYGGERGPRLPGIPIPIFDIEDLQKAADLMEEKHGRAADWESVSEWLADAGYDLVGTAMNLCQQRQALTGEGGDDAK